MSKTAFLLAGGGSRGITQSAFLLCLQDLGITYDAIFGSSVGSLNSAMVHGNDHDKMINLWLNIKDSDVFEDKGALDLAACYKRGYLHESAPLKRLIDSSIDYDKIIANPKDFCINTTDLSTNLPYSRESKSFVNKEQFVDFVYASASPPIFFPPVDFEGQQLCDSGVINNYSITESINMGYDTLILLLPYKYSPNSLSTNIIDLAGKIIALSMQSYMNTESKSIIKINNIIDTINSEIQAGKCSTILDSKDFPKKIKLITIVPEQVPTFGFLDFDYAGLNRQDLINQGYNRCKSIIESEWP